MCVYIYIYIYVCVYIYIYISTYLCMYNASHVFYVTVTHWGSFLLLFMLLPPPLAMRPGQRFEARDVRLRTVLGLALEACSDYKARVSSLLPKFRRCLALAHPGWLSPGGRPGAAAHPAARPGEPVSDQHLGMQPIAEEVRGGERPTCSQPPRRPKIRGVCRA